MQNANNMVATNRSSKRKLHKSLAKPNRIWELDFIRGICVILMIWDHFMFDIMDIFGKAWVTANATNYAIVDLANNYFSGMLREVFHPIIFCLFFMLCGISCNLSRNNLKRGMAALFLAFGITFVSSLFNMSITFGVLHMLGFSILIYYIISKLCFEDKRLISMVCLIAAICIIIATQVYTQNPPENANNNLGFIANYLGAYASADYFPMLPNLAYVLLGASVGGLVYKDKTSVLPMLDKYGWYKPVNFLGSKALLVYIVHQPILITILSIISYLFITPGDFVFI